LVPVGTVCMTSFMPHVSPIRYSLAQCCRKWPHFQSPQAKRCWSKKHMFQELRAGISVVHKPLVLFPHCLDDSCCRHTWCRVVQTMDRIGWSTGVETGRWSGMRLCRRRCWSYKQDGWMGYALQQRLPKISFEEEEAQGFRRCKSGKMMNNARL
jgi:hypothetical protein